MPNLDEHFEPGNLEEIAEEECWRLLAGKPVGRVGVIARGYPIILPVNYAVVAHGVIFRTDSGTKLWSISRKNVSFEVDEIDVENKIGWSVLVRGAAREITIDRNPELVRAVQAGAPIPWAAGTKEHIVRIVADSISGRRIRPTEPPSETDLRGYL